MKAIVMAPPAQPRWRRRLVLGGVAAAIVLAHGWGLSTVGRAALAETDLPARPAPFTVRSLPAEPMQATAIAMAVATPVPVTALPPAASPRRLLPAAQPNVAAAQPAEEAVQPAAPEDSQPTLSDASPAEPEPAEAPEPAQPAAAATLEPSPHEVPAAQAAGASDPEDAAVLLAANTPKKAPARTDAVEVPVYPVRLPAAFSARYRLQRGMLSGTGTLRWAPAADGSRYEARLDGAVAGFTVLDWTSTGLIDRAGVAPERFLMKRRGRDAQAANFQRAAGKITYSGPSVQYDLPAGAQDRLSWMLQIGGVLNASPKRFDVGSRITFFVSGARGDADVWQFSVAGLESVPAGGGRDTMALKLVREPRKPFDTRVEVWLDPAREHRPVLARLATNGNDDALELRLAE